LAWRRYQGHPIDVAFAQPLRASELLAQDRDSRRITRVVTERALELGPDGVAILPEAEAAA